MKTKLVLIASVCGLASAPSAWAFDYFESTFSIPATTTAWTNNLTLGAYNAYLATLPAVVHPFSDLDLLFGIKVTWSIVDNGTFRYANNDPVLGHTIKYEFAGTNLLDFPSGAFLPQQVELTELGTNTVGRFTGNPLAGGPGGTNDFAAAYGFINTLTQTSTNLYYIPVANYPVFNGADVIFTNTASSESAFTVAPTPNYSERANDAASTVTVTFAFVPEANPLYAVVPVAALGGGFTILRRNRKKRALKA